MRRLSAVAIIVIAASAMSVQATPTTYSGSLTSADGGILGDGGWVGNPDNHVTFSWTVTRNPDASWHYRYVLNSTGLQGELSHLILETSRSFRAEDISNETPSIEADCPKWYAEANGNPSLPETVFGIKFDAVSGTVVTMDFDSRRNPVWGDFFGKGGANGGQVWNAGFTASDVDPVAGPQNGSIAYHALVPDTTTTVPTPGAFLLGAIGTSLIGYLRRRKTL